MLHTFAETARQNLRFEGNDYRCDHPRAFAQRVEVAEREVFIKGRKTYFCARLPLSETGGSGRTQFCTELAEREGFEPSVRFDPYARFPGVYLKPLGHLSC